MIIGGPPCQAYSIAGRVRDEHGMKNDYRNYLFESYIKVLERYKPKAFLFENVPGILSAKPGDRPIIDIIQESFETVGYHIMKDLRKAVIDFTEYGVPQNRKRVIIFGVRKDLFKENSEEIVKSFYFSVLPKYKSSRKITVRDAIGDLPKLYPQEEDSKYNGARTRHSLPDPMVANHVARWQSDRDVGIFKLLTEDIESGRNKYVSISALKELYTKMTGKNSNVHKYHVIKWDEPSNLIPAHLYKDGLRHIHPDSSQCRTLTVREAARLQTFADDYIFEGSNMELYKMIGNAVPSLAAKCCANAVYDQLYDRFKGDGLTRLPLLLGLYTDESFKTRKADGSDAAGDNSVERNHGRAIRPYVNLSKPSSGKKDISYEYVPGPFMRMYVKALKNSRTDNIKPFLLIIEEINRANVAAVFGDIFQLLDRGDDFVSEYPIQAKQIDNSGIYFEANLSANGIISFIKDLLAKLQLDTDDFSFSLSEVPFDIDNEDTWAEGLIPVAKLFYNFVENLVEKELIDSAELENLKTKEYTKKLFQATDYPAIANNRTDNMGNSLQKRYRAKAINFNGSEIYVSTQFFDSDRDAVIDWYRSHL